MLAEFTPACFKLGQILGMTRNKPLPLDNMSCGSGSITKEMQTE